MATDRTHIQRWAPQDYRTSKVRARSIRTGDPMLRLVYLELLFALFERGGELPDDLEVLTDELGLPAEEIESALDTLSRLQAADAASRGGILREGGRISNPRVSEELADEAEYRKSQAALGRKGGRAKAKASLSGRQAKTKRPPSDRQANAQRSVSPPAPAPAPTPTPAPEREASPTTSGGPRADGKPDDREARSKTPQQRYVDSAWAIYDGVSVPRPQAGLLGRWAREFFRGDYGWALRELDALAVTGHLAKGASYVSKALQGAATRARAGARGERGGPPAADGADAPRFEVGATTRDGLLTWDGERWAPTKRAAAGGEA